MGKQIPTGPATPDKRGETHYAASDKDDWAPSRRRHGAFFSSFDFGDIVSARHHTIDFKDSRAAYIAIRLRFMALFFALAVPAYALVDYFTLAYDQVLSIGVARLVLGVIHVIVCLITLRKLSIVQVNVLLGVDILAAALFCVTSLYVLQGGVGGIAPVAYTFMPFMVIVMLGLFPLTLLSSLIIMALVVGPYIGLQALTGTLLSRGSFSTLFLFALFMGIVLWLQSGQLLMLLRLYRESTRDILTGLINRRVLRKFLADEIDENKNKGRSFSLLMIDLDRFKLINDDHGHLTGDLVLRATARMLENELRLGDIVARFGGEEFVAVLPGLKTDQAVAVAERICSACGDIRIPAPDGSLITFTTSIGVSEYIAGEKIEATLKRADESLYIAKEQGRNRVVSNPHIG